MGWTGKRDKTLVATGQPQREPLRSAGNDRAARYYDVENGYEDGVLFMYPFESRYYFHNGMAPQTIGYTSKIQADEVDDYLQAGYSLNEMVGRQGIEV